MQFVCVSVLGRGLKSHAYTHSVQFTHHVFLNLHTLKFYCLPDNYEIIDSSLEDITVGRDKTNKNNIATEIIKQIVLHCSFNQEVNKQLQENLGIHISFPLIQDFQLLNY